MVMLWNPFRLAAEAGGGSSGGAGDHGTAPPSVVDDAALLLKEYRGHGYEVVDLAVLPDNSRFVSVGGDRAAFVFDVTSGVAVRRLFGHEQRLTCVALSEDGAVVLTGSHDKTVRAWDMRSSSRTPLQVLSDFSDNVTGVAARRTEVVASCMDGVLRTYDLRRGRLIQDGVDANGVTALGVTADGLCAVAAAATCGGSLHIVDKRWGGGEGSGDGDDGVTRVVSTLTGHANSLYTLRPAFTAGDEAVVCGSEDGRVCFWDLLTPTPAAVLSGGHSRVVSAVAPFPGTATVCGGGAGPQPSLLLTASFDGCAKLWAPPGEHDGLAAAYAL